MTSSSTASNSKLRSEGDEPSRGLPHFDSRRRAEFEGFLLCILGLLFLLSLVSYHTGDLSLDTSASSWSAIHNLIGRCGAYLADALLQGLGWTAYAIPFTLLLVGARRMLNRPFAAPRTKAVGAVLLVASLAALLDLVPMAPPVAGLIRAGGLAGYLLRVGMVNAFNQLGAGIVAGAVLLASLFLVTKFSFAYAGRLLKAQFAPLAGIGLSWRAWREARERERLKKKLDEERKTGKPPIVVGPTQPLTKAAVRPAPVAPPEPEIKRRTPRPLESPDDSDEDESVFEDAASEPLAEPRVVEGQGLGLSPKASLTPSPAGARRAPVNPGKPSLVRRKYKLPSAALLRPPEEEQGVDEAELKERASRLVEKLAEFGVTGAVTQIHPGPVVTTFEFKPEAGIKYSRITNLVDDLCLALKAESILIERVPGKSTVGIEVPNMHREVIYLRELVEGSDFASSPSKLTLCIGKDITGKMKVADLTQMPHVLIAGSTGSGKSVAINAMIVSMLYKATPDEVRLIMIDPKRLELNLYDGIPHLYTPIVTEPKVAANVLRRATTEMEERLKKLAEQGVRNIEQYNRLFESGSTLNLFDNDGEAQGPLPYLVIVIDELADLMMVEPQTVEESITRLAQMARAVGIHLILATQRPSVDVITGLIKANMPSRISFRVASKVDSRTILDANGSEALLGRGDMLFLPPATSRLLRLHGSLVTEKEINKVVDWWKAQSPPQYNENFLKPVGDGEAEIDDPEDEDSAGLDEVYEEAVRLVVESGKASTSLLQRRLRLGYGRAARLLDMMQRDGIISAPDGSRPREVLKRPEWLQEVEEPLR
ncbi:MAG TPA: DNA translocase FtsK [Terriglobia bacterium]|nr:DNA translocase FtsK [Terriglobia bacterium]